MNKKDSCDKRNQLPTSNYARETQAILKKHTVYMYHNVLNSNLELLYILTQFVFPENPLQ